MTKFIVVDRTTDGRYSVDGSFCDSLVEALGVASEIKAREGGIIANLASSARKTFNKTSSHDTNLGGSNYRIDT